jgi:hypothetical protein
MISWRIDPDRGAVAIEVKGSLVHESRGALRELIAPSGLRKRIDAFGQLKIPFAGVGDAAGVDVTAVAESLVLVVVKAIKGASRRKAWVRNDLGAPEACAWKRETREVLGSAVMNKNTSGSTLGPTFLMRPSRCDNCEQGERWARVAESGTCGSRSCRSRTWWRVDTD